MLIMVGRYTWVAVAWGPSLSISLLASWELRQFFRLYTRSDGL